LFINQLPYYQNILFKNRKSSHKFSVHVCYFNFMLLCTSFWSFRIKTIVDELWSLIMVQKSTLVSGSGNCVARYPTNFVYDWNSLVQYSKERVKEKISNTELDIYSFKKVHHLSNLSWLSYTIISFTVTNIAGMIYLCWTFSKLFSVCSHSSLSITRNQNTKHWKS
jgi:chloramphenicol O-acetyltransferase